MRIDTDYDFEDQWSKFGKDPHPKAASLHEAIFSNIDSHTSFGLAGRDIAHLTELSSLDHRAQSVFLGTAGSEESIISKNNIDASAEVHVDVKWGGKDGAKTTFVGSGTVSDQKGNSIKLEASRTSDGENRLRATAAATTNPPSQAGNKEPQKK